MRRLTIAITFVLLATTIALAQQPTPSPQAKPAQSTVAQPNAEQKAQIVALAKAWQQKAQEADAARDKYMIQLLAVLAELGLKPSETSITWNDKGEPVFQRVEPAQAQTTPNKTPAKSEAKP